VFKCISSIFALAMTSLADHDVQSLANLNENEIKRLVEDELNISISGEQKSSKNTFFYICLLLSCLVACILSFCFTISFLKIADDNSFLTPELDADPTSRKSHASPELDEDSKSETFDELTYYERKLKDQELMTGHQKKFHEKYGTINKFDKSRLFPTDRFEFAAISLADKFAYLHIWKCGGTSVSGGKPQAGIYDPKILSSTLFTFVRDPIKHFMSGWQECMERHAKELMKNGGDPNFLLANYDEVIHNWLVDTRHSSDKHDKHKRLIETSDPNCIRHSHPMINSMLGNDFQFLPNLKLIADLSELSQVLSILGIEYVHKDGYIRNSTINVLKQRYFPVDMEELSLRTLLEICDYVALDYCFLDFKPPALCEDLINEICSL